MVSLETPTVRSVALKFGWLAVALLVLFAPLRLCASMDALGRQTEITGYAPNPNPIAGGTAVAYYGCLQSAYRLRLENLRQQVETYPGGQLAGRTVDLSYDS